MSVAQLNCDLEGQKDRRKAKAEGMREAAGIVLRSRGYVRNAGKPWAEDMPANKEDLISEIMNAADKIERGE